MTIEKIGKYQIIEVLGKGAMGIVYKAKDPDIDRIVAIKTIRFDKADEPTDQTEMMQRFMREAQAVGKLEHSNIVTIYDVGREEDLTYIVMQYVEGHSLQKINESGKRPSLPEIVQLMSSVCSALDFAHQAGVIHRDMKPGNILLDKNGIPFIVDFGVARVGMSTMTSTGTIIGTPSYMAPEQVMGQQVDRRADIFSLGVILYELITGKRPFEGEHITTVAYKIIHEEPLHLKEVKQDIPEDFETIVDKALAKKADERYQTCLELYSDLQEVMNKFDRTIPFTPGEEVFVGFRDERKKKKNWIPVAIPVAAVLVALAGAYFFIPGVKQMLTSNPGEGAIVAPLQSRQILMDSGVREDQEFSYIPRKAPVKPQRNEALIARKFDEGVQSYQHGDYTRAAALMTEVLRLDKQHREARSYQNLTNSALDSIGNIKTIVERQRKAEEEKELPLLLSDLGSDSLYRKRSSEARQFFNEYGDIKSIVDISKIRIEFIDTDKAQVSFPKLLSAVHTQTGKRSIVFEGEMIWVMEKQANGWKIVDFLTKTF